MSPSPYEPLLVLLSFGVLALAAQQLGVRASRVGLPLISGFILLGVIAGPYALQLLSAHETIYLQLVDAIALPFIALAAGAELRVDVLRRRLRGIFTIISVLAATVFVGGVVGMLLLGDLIAFADQLPFAQQIAIALLGGTILVAISPSAAIAVIKEVRAKGAFTQTALGVTILMDSVVILLFAVMASIAKVIVLGASFSLTIVLVVTMEIALDILSGALIAKILTGVVWVPLQNYIKTALILLTCFGVFSLARTLGHFELPGLPVSLFSEPLLICMVAGFMLSNTTRLRAEFIKLIETIAPTVFLLFFTAVGATLELPVLVASWGAALILLVIRFFGMWLGGWIGGALAGIPANERRLLGLSFLTQAGISLGLTKEVAASFPEWGGAFASLFVGIIVMNTLVGPSFFKLVLHLSGNAHTRAEGPEIEGPHNVVIFGIELQSIELAQQLVMNDWTVRLVDKDTFHIEQYVQSTVPMYHLEVITPDSLREIGMDHASTIVLLMDDESNFRICELAYEHFGTDHIVVRLRDSENAERFRELGVSVVDPKMAMVNLLDHFIRSPSAASLLLGQEEDKDVIDVEVTNPYLHGLALRDLHLPSGVLILAVRRRGQLLLSHGYTRLRLGDEVTVLGERDNLHELEARFSFSNNPHDPRKREEF